MTRVRSRKAKTAQSPIPQSPASPKKKPPKISGEEKRRRKAEFRVEAHRRRRQEAREVELAKPILPPASKMCSEKELRFVLEYMKDLNGSAAILRAGITKNAAVSRTYASRYLDRPHVIMELASRRADLIARSELSLEWVLERLRQIGASQISDVVTWNDRGELIINPKTELTEQQLAAIASIKEIPGLLGSQLEVKMHDKVAALKDLRRHLSPGLAESRFGDAGSGPRSATIVIMGGPTGLEVGVGEYEADP